MRTVEDRLHWPHVGKADAATRYYPECGVNERPYYPRQDNARGQLRHARRVFCAEHAGHGHKRYESTISDLRASTMKKNDSECRDNSDQFKILIADHVVGKALSWPPIGISKLATASKPAAHNPISGSRSRFKGFSIIYPSACRLQESGMLQCNIM